MERGNFLTKVLAGLLGFTFIQCSEVSFSPGDETNRTGGTVITEPPPGEKVFTESFMQKAEEQKEVDVLVVVDNSASMYEEQQKLGERIESFIGRLNKIDWRIGITTTDVSTGKYGLRGKLVQIEGTNNYWIEKGEDKVLDKFLSTVVREETLNCTAFSCPSGSEQPLMATIYAMEKHDDENKGFFRENANVAVIYISDEDEMSSGPTQATQPIDVLNAFEDNFGPEKSLSAYGIIIEPGDQDCLNENLKHNDAYYGEHVNELVQLTGGVSGSICEDDYGKDLKKIGKRLVKLINSFQLKNFPDEESVKVKLIPHQDGHTWSVEGNLIRFEVPPPNGTRIEVTYKLPQSEDDGEDQEADDLSDEDSEDSEDSEDGDSEDSDKD